MKYKIFNAAEKPIFWQEKPSECNSPIWRYSDNPIIDRNPVKNIDRIFNSGISIYNDKFVGIFRGDTTNGIPQLFLGWSEDSINWKIDQNKILFFDLNGQPFQPVYSYDPRLIKIDDTYYIIWCTDFNGPTMGLARTKDFKYFERLPHGFLPYNRNCVLFPEKIKGKYLMLSRPSDNGHTKFGDIFVSESPDLIYWGNHKLLMKKSIYGEWWESLKIGAGPAPIKTDQGWLLIYHGVASTCNGFVYSIGGAILDLDDPTKVKYRTDQFLMSPKEWYEERGFVPNVVFPCAALNDNSGHVSIFYGAADTYLALAFSTIDILIDFIKDNNSL